MSNKHNKILSEVTVYEEMPKGWRKTEGATTAPRGYYWASNNKSHFGGERKQALIKIPETVKEVSMANKTSRTVSQEAAYNAGLGFASGKANRRVTVKPENQDAFRDGVKKGRSIIAKGKTAKPSAPNSASFSNAQKIEYYSGRIADPKLSEAQRQFAARRLREFAK